MMNKDEMIRYDAERTALESQLEDKYYAVQTCYDFRITSITEEGVYISANYQHCGGCDTDYYTYTFTWEQVAMTLEEFKADYAEQERLKAIKQQKDNEAREKREKIARERKKIADKVAKEKAERETYKRLRKKFENNP